MRLINVTDDTFLQVAMKNYNNHSCLTLEDFQNDLKHFTYIKKQIGKDDNNIRLVLNHIIILFNIFEEATLSMLFYKIEPEYWGKLAAYLLYINRLPQELITLFSIDVDLNIIEELRKL